MLLAAYLSTSSVVASAQTAPATSIQPSVVAQGESGGATSGGATSAAPAPEAPEAPAAPPPPPAAEELPPGPAAGPQAAFYADPAFLIGAGVVTAAVVCALVCFGSSRSTTTSTVTTGH